MRFVLVNFSSSFDFGTDFLLARFSDSFADLSSTVSRLTKALVLTPIAAFFTFVALILTLIPRRGAACCAILTSTLAIITTILALGLELGLFIVIRNKLNEASPDSASLGKGNWCVYPPSRLGFDDG